MPLSSAVMSPIGGPALLAAAGGRGLNFSQASNSQYYFLLFAW
jgi:hypothetical protein